MNTTSQTAGYIEVFDNYSTWRAEMSGTVPGASATPDWHCDVEDHSSRQDEGES